MSLHGISENGSFSQEKETDEILSSKESLSHFEKKNFKNLLPQIIASVFSALFFTVSGVSSNYLAILLNNLSGDSSDFSITHNQLRLLGVVWIFVIPVGATLCGFLIDKIGRLNCLKLSLVPAIIGWITIQTSSGITTLVIGSTLTGLATAFGTCPAIVYITEIANPDIRGSLLSLGPAFAALGGVLAQLENAIFHWRTVAGVTNVYVIVALVSILFIPESPAWLISKGRNEQAKKALNWFYKYQPKPKDDVTFAQLKFEYFVEEEKAKSKRIGCFAKVKDFVKPTGYKPFLILLGLFFFQQFSGAYFINLYMISMLQGIIEYSYQFLNMLFLGLLLLTSIVNIFLLKIFCRRTLMIYGLAAMTISMFIASLLYTFNKDNFTLTWVYILFVFVYMVSSMLSLLTIPSTMIAELFPIEIRGMAYCTVYSLSYLLMIASTHFNVFLANYFNELFNVGWFFAGMSLAGLVYVYIFVPETHNKKLSDLQKFFENGSVYIRWVRAKERVKRESERQNEEIMMDNV